MSGDDTPSYCPACGRPGRDQTEDIAWCVNQLCRVRGFEVFPTRGYLAALETGLECPPGIDC